MTWHDAFMVLGFALGLALLAFLVCTALGACAMTAYVMRKRPPGVEQLEEECADLRRTLRIVAKGDELSATRELVETIEHLHTEQVRADKLRGELEQSRRAFEELREGVAGRYGGGVLPDRRAVDEARDEALRAAAEYIGSKPEDEIRARGAYKRAMNALELAESAHASSLPP